MSENVVIVVGAFVACVGVFLTLRGALWLLEKASPRFSRWLDDIQPEWTRPW